MNFNEKKSISSEKSKTRNNIKSLKNSPIKIVQHTSMRSSFSSGGIDYDKQENLSMKKLMNATNTTLPRLTKNSYKEHFININKKLTNDLNYQINTLNKRIFGNLFSYKQTINLQEINDYLIYEKTKKSIAEHKLNGKKNTIDFRIPIAYRRLDNHYKKEDLIPIKMKPKINLEDVLYMHNSIFRKSVSQNNCKKYYLKNNMKLIRKDKKLKHINKNAPLQINKLSKTTSFNNINNMKS